MLIIWFSDFTSLILRTIKQINELSQNLPTGTHSSRFPSSCECQLFCALGSTHLLILHTLSRWWRHCISCTTAASVTSLPLTLGFLNFKIVILWWSCLIFTDWFRILKRKRSKSKVSLFSEIRGKFPPELRIITQVSPLLIASTGIYFF